MSADVIPLHAGLRLNCSVCEKPMARTTDGFQCRQSLCGLGFMRIKGGFNIRREDGAYVLEPDGQDS